LILSEVIEKKYIKCERKTFMLLHKREYGLLLVLARSRNCWNSHKPEWQWVNIFQRTCNCVWFEPC